MFMRPLRSCPDGTPTTRLLLGWGDSTLDLGGECGTEEQRRWSRRGALGQGAYGQVRPGTLFRANDTPRSIVVKISLQDQEDMDSEAHMATEWKELIVHGLLFCGTRAPFNEQLLELVQSHHCRATPSVPQLFAAGTGWLQLGSTMADPKRARIVAMEPVDLTLKDYVRRESLGGDTKDELYDILTQMAVLLLYLQQAFSFAHNDMHSANVMLKQRDGSMTVFLIDYGMAQCRTSDQMVERGMAEVALAADYPVDFSLDLLMLSCHLFTIAIGREGNPALAHLKEHFLDDMMREMIAQVTSQPASSDPGETGYARMHKYWLDADLRFREVPRFSNMGKWDRTYGTYNGNLHWIAYPMYAAGIGFAPTLPAEYIRRLDEARRR